MFIGYQWIFVVGALPTTSSPMILLDSALQHVVVYGSRWLAPPAMGWRVDDDDGVDGSVHEDQRIGTTDDRTISGKAADLVATSTTNKISQNIFHVTPLSTLHEVGSNTESMSPTMSRRWLLLRVLIA